MPRFTGNPEDMPEGELFYLVNLEPFRVEENNISWDEETEQYTGELKINPITSKSVENVETLGGKEIRGFIEKGDLFKISERVEENPEEVMKEFAVEELSNYLSSLGPTHDYNGIKGVEELGDLVAARWLSR